jgi:hypothetical protein
MQVTKDSYFIADVVFTVANRDEKLTKLESLELFANQNESFQNSSLTVNLLNVHSLTDTQLHRLAGLKRLVVKTLSLEKAMGLTSKGLEDFSNAQGRHSLEHLDIRGARNIQWHDLQHYIDHWDHLEKISFSLSRILNYEEAIPEMLKKCPDLKEIEISNLHLASKTSDQVEIDIEKIKSDFKDRKLNIHFSTHT